MNNENLRLYIFSEVRNFFDLLMLARENNVAVLSDERLDYSDFLKLGWDDLEILRGQIGHYAMGNSRRFIPSELKELGKILLNLSIRAEQLRPDGIIMARKPYARLNNSSVWY